MLGHTIMIISSIPGIIGSNASLGVFILSMIVTSTGNGGFKSNVSPLVAEQYRITKCYVTATRSGERVIVYPAMTATRIYMVRRAQRVSQAATDTTRSISTFLSTLALSSVRSECFMLKRYVLNSSPWIF
jgi:dipeptide/tripeptide permease